MRNLQMSLMRKGKPQRPFLYVTQGTEEEIFW